MKLNLSVVKILNSVGLRNVGVLEWVITICLLILSKPYFVWHSYVPTIATVISVLVALGFHEVPYGKKFYGFLCLCLFYLLVAIRHTSLGGAIVLCMMPLLLLISKKSFLNAFHNFVIFLAFLLVPSLIMYVLVTFLGVGIPSVEVQPINELKEYTYSQYPFLIIDNIERGLIVTRFHALFDEPGVIGSIAGLVLWVNGFNLRKWYNIVLFISGIFSFSLFFYLITIIYIIIYSKIKTKTSIILFLVISIPILLQLLPDLEILLFNRFKIEDGVWVGNSRSASGFDFWYHSFKKTDAYMFGLGAGSNLIYNPGGASYRDIIVNYGLISFLLYCLSWILLSLSNLPKKYFLLSTLIIMMFIFQRPFIFDSFIQFMFLYSVYAPLEAVQLNQLLSKK